MLVSILGCVLLNLMLVLAASFVCFCCYVGVVSLFCLSVLVLACFLGSWALVIVFGLDFCVWLCFVLGFGVGSGC